VAKKTKIALVVKILTRCLTVSVLLSVYLGSLNLATAEAARTSDEVFCPLQKTWVRKSPATVLSQKQRDPLKDICGRDERKTEFLLQLSESLRLTRARPTSQEIIKLFFAYFTDGKPALTRFISSQNVPEPQYFSGSIQEKGVNNTRSDLAQNTDKVFALARVRSVIALSETNFVSQYPPKLKNISRCIKPRAPPSLV
jgi:hypothetical protein